MIKRFFSHYFELGFWIAALISLAFTDPTAQPHFALCPLKWLGLTWCPGCGLGHSISWLLHGDIKGAVHAHWLGIPAVIIILQRVWILSRERIYKRQQFQSVNILEARK